MLSVRPFQSRYPHVRRVKDRWQARIWDGRIHSHWNLGLYIEERAAHEAARRFLQFGEIPPSVYPRHVRRRGNGLFGVIWRPGSPVLRIGPFRTAAVAHAAVIAELLRGDHDDRAYATSLLTAANPGIAAYVVLARPCRRDWFWSLRAAVSAELVEECRRRISAGGGYGAAARRWASG